ncbi:protein Abitram isoform X4 [Punica granatum]|uniref:Protein Abitram n=1 Tax=Punica granatum TaxID=22663 RepID=A0A6P8EMM7_PUNGR|nr:protein Abitram isoform X4 [Punica granatum]
MNDGTLGDSGVDETRVQSIEGPELREAVTLDEREEVGDGDDELRKLLVPDVSTLPITPPSSVEFNFDVYFAPGLAPTHLAFKGEGGITAVDFNVGKFDRSQKKVTGKRKRNAQHFESNTALCKVSTNKDSYIVRCCVKGSLLEVNDKLIKQPALLNSSADREGYIAIIMPKAQDWVKIKGSLLSLEEYKRLREPNRTTETI